MTHKQILSCEAFQITVYLRDAAINPASDPTSSLLDSFTGISADQC